MVDGDNADGDEAEAEKTFCHRLHGSLPGNFPCGSR